MKVVILAGGLGTRLTELTDVIPKPMVPVGGKPILWHIMQTYAKFGHKDFFIALGYKAEIVKEYFLNYRSLNADFEVDLSTGLVSYHQTDAVDWRVTLVDTGMKTMTGGRVKQMQEFVGNDTFMLTYGDGVADIDINSLLEFHRKHGKLVTITAVHPPSRFGELQLDGDKVGNFREKSQMNSSWINGGFLIIEPGFFKFLEGEDTMLELQPLERVAAIGELMAYRHEGFWQCMDTKRDHEHLESLWSSGAPWIN